MAKSNRARKWKVLDFLKLESMLNPFESFHHGFHMLKTRRLKANTPNQTGAEDGYSTPKHHQGRSASGDENGSQTSVMECKGIATKY